ncbi:MAG TPA: V-type ATPase subunit [Gemmatimonadales bacterium]
MSAGFEALNARARGLETHLLRRADLDRLARAPDPETLAAALRAVGVPLAEGELAPAALDLGLRRLAAARLRVLARWCGDRPAVRLVLFGDEDRRSLRAVVRGAAHGVPAEVRLSGLVPTPALPERALRELAGQPTASAAAALLVAWGNPYGPALLDAATSAHPDLLRLELALNRGWAVRAGRAAAGEGGVLEQYVRESIDLENAFTALALAGERTDVAPKDAFLRGGAHLGIDTFETAAAGAATDAPRTLARAFGDTPLGQAFERYGAEASLEDHILRVRIRSLVRAMRTAPLGAAPWLVCALRLRAEILDLRRIVWGVALAAPQDDIAGALVTAG